MHQLRHATPLLLIALAACGAQSPAVNAANEAMGRTAPEAAPAPVPAPAAPEPAAAPSAPPVAAPPVLGPQPVRAWGTGPAAVPMIEDEPAPVAASGQDANDPAMTTVKASVLRAQVLLLLAHYSGGEIDRLAGKNVGRGVRGYLAAQGI